MRADVPHDYSARPRHAEQLRKGRRRDESLEEVSSSSFEIVVQLISESAVQQQQNRDESLEEAGAAHERVVRVVGDRRRLLGVHAGRVHVLQRTKFGTADR